MILIDQTFFFDQSGPRTTTQIRVLTSPQYGISPILPQKSFRGETFGDLAKCWLFSQATKSQEHFICSKDLQHYFTQIICAQNDCKREVRLQKMIEDLKQRYCNYLNGQHILVSTFINLYSNVKGTLSIICQTIKSGLCICDF